MKTIIYRAPYLFLKGTALYFNGSHSGWVTGKSTTVAHLAESLPKTWFGLPKGKLKVVG